MAATTSENLAGLSLEELETLIASFKPGDDPRQQAEVLDYAGLAALARGDGPRARGHLERGEKLLKDAGVDLAATPIPGHLASAYRSLGLLDAALSRFHDALAALEQRPAPGPELRAALLIDYAGALLAAGEVAAAHDRYQQAQALCEADATLAAWLPSVLRGLADAASRQGHEAEAEGALARALALLDEKPNPRAQAATLLALGQVRRRQGDWTGARPSFEQGLDLARALGDTRSEAYFLLELGYLESETGQGERGVALLEEARRLFAALADAKGLDSAERRQGEAQLKLAGSSLGMTLLGHDIGGQSNTRPVDLTGSDLPWPGDPGDSKRPTPTPRRAKREAGPVRGAWAGNPLEGLR